jgi:predicted metal-dependent hydrolase
MENFIEDSEVQYGTTTIKFKVHYSSRKTLGIEVHPDRSIKVVAPNGSEINRILRKVEHKAPWIQKQVRKFTKVERQDSIKEFVSGENIFYLGRRYRLKVLKGDSNVKLVGKFLMLTLPNKEDKKHASQLIEDWYMRHAVKKLNDRFNLLSEVSKKEKIKFNKLYIKPIQKRWGSCTKLGNITLNVNLIKVPVDCIDYVIMHELCHLKYLNHSPKFYRLLDKYSPNWKYLQEKLNKF